MKLKKEHKFVIKKQLASPPPFVFSSVSDVTKSYQVTRPTSKHAKISFVKLNESNDHLQK